MPNSRACFQANSSWHGRVRRRRAIASSVAAVVAVLFVTSLGYAATGSPKVTVPTPPASADPDGGWPRITDLAATGPADIYAVVERCRDCGSQLYASDDAGATWQRRPVPPAPDDAAGAHVVSLGPGALAWRYARVVSLRELQEVSPQVQGSPPASPTAPAHLATSPPGTERLWTTIDGGRTWRQAVVEAKPVAAAPPGTRPVDCGLLGQAPPCRIYAVDMASGRFAPLAHQPPGITAEQVGPRAASWMADVPLGADAWVTGLDPATGKPAVASSSDGGRTWHTHVFADVAPSVADQGKTASRYFRPTVAAGTGGTAYALIYRDRDLWNSYRTTDGGVTWRPIPGGAPAELSDTATVTADGAHIVRSGREFLASRDGGRYQRVTLPGYPAEGWVMTQEAAGRYMEFSDWSLHVSDDGWTWRRVDVP